MKFTAAEMLADVKAAGEKIDKVLDGVEYIGVNDNIGVVLDGAPTATVSPLSTMPGDKGVSVKLEVCGKPTMILTVCEDEMLCIDTKDVKWHIASIRVKACR